MSQKQLEGLLRLLKSATLTISSTLHPQNATKTRLRAALIGLMLNQKRVCSGGISYPEPIDVMCEYLPAGSSYSVIITIIVVAAVVINAFFLIKLLSNLSKPVIRASQPDFCAVLLCAACAHSLSSLTLTGKNTNVSCIIRPWLMHMTFMLVLGVLSVKCMRIVRILRGAEMYIKRDLPRKEAWRYVGGLIVLTVVCLLVSTFVDAEQVAAKIVNVTVSPLVDDFPQTVCAGGAVMFNSVLIFVEVALVLYTAMAAYQTQSILTDKKNQSLFKIQLDGNLFGFILDESKQLMLAIYTVALVDGVVLLGTEVLMKDSISTANRIILHSVCMNVTQTVAMCMIFIPKFLTSSSSDYKVGIQKEKSFKTPTAILAGNNMDDIKAGCTLSVLINEKVFKVIVKDRYYQDHEELPHRDMKILLLGGGGVGKSTIFKQMRLMYCGGFSDDDRKWAKGNIYENVLEVITDLDRLSENLDIELDDDIGDMLDAVNEEYQQKFKVRTAGDDVPSVLVWDEVKAIWADENIQSSFQSYGKSDADDNLQNHVLSRDFAEYFLNKLDVITKINYQPSEEDILKLRRPTNNMDTLKFNLTLDPYANLDVVCTDVGGQVQERNLWSKLAKEANGIMFLMSLGEVDQCDDSGTNNFLSQIRLLDSTCRSNFMKGTSLVVVLNKRDIFESKFPEMETSKHFSSYQGGNNADELYEYIVGLVKSTVASTHTKGVEVVSCCATDSSIAQSVIKGVITSVEKHVAQAI